MKCFDIKFLDKIMSATREKSSLVPFRKFIGRIFNNSNGNDAPDTSSKLKINEISGPFNTIHKIHVGFDGTSYSGLPEAWLEVLRRELTYDFL